MRNAWLASALAVTLLALSAGVAPAQELKDKDADPNFVVGHVRLDEVFEKSERISGKIAALQAKYRAGQDQLDRQYKDLAMQRDNFESQKKFMSESGRKEASRRLMDALEKYRTDYKNQADALEAEKRKALAPEVEYLWDIVAKIGEARHYDIIFDEADLAYAAPEFDISAEVIRKLDEAPPTPKPTATPVPPPAPETGTMGTAQ